MLRRIKRFLASKEEQNAKLADWIAGHIGEMVERGEQHKDLVTVRSNPLEGSEAFVELGFVRDTAIRDNPELGALFQSRWGDYLGAYNVSAGFPRPGGSMTVLFLAAYDAPWASLSREEILAGIAGGAAYEFFAELEKLLSLARKGRL
jgi:hypothetical protein